MGNLEKKIEEEHGRTLTNRQKTFARHIVEGIYSNAECARRRGLLMRMSQSLHQNF
jgi:hypothetical protein